MAEKRPSPTPSRSSLEVSGSSSKEDYDDLRLPMRYRAPLISNALPPKTTFAAFILTLGGIIFLTLGLTIMYNHVKYNGADRGLAIIVLGGIMFCPGSYASFILYGSWRGWRGFDYSQIPSYDHD